MRSEHGVEWTAQVCWNISLFGQMDISQCDGFLFPLFQKIVKHVVEKTYLHVLCTPVPEEFLDQNVVFFLRNTKGIFPVGVGVGACAGVYV